MGRLLFELLSEVFDKYLEDEHWSQMLEDAPRPLVSRTCHSDPGQICSFRRAVALGYPQLWQNIVILNPKKSQIYLTEQWLKRAGTALLDLTVYMPNEDSTYDAVCSILCSFSRTEYWREIGLQLPFDFVTRHMFLFPTTSKTCSHLESAKFMPTVNDPYSLSLGAIL